MKTCSDDCYPACDFCKHYDFNGLKMPDGSVVYTGDGRCKLHGWQMDPEQHCEDFWCFRLDAESA